MRVLADFHHHALAESLLMLFEDRFGCDVYFPYSMDWFDEEVWQFERAWHGDKVARQYLEGIWAGYTPREDGGIMRVDPRHPGRYQHGITLGAARMMHWDLVISSLPHNDPGFRRFADLAGAKMIVQVGNHMQDSLWGAADYILASSTLPGHTSPDEWGRPFIWNGKPTIIYHQEFALDTFRQRLPAKGREVASWVNCFPETPVYPAFREFARRTATDFDWKVYGAYGSAQPDELAAGDVSLVPEIADRMSDARIAWHEKSWSDGFGHVIHNWFALGRPVIGVPRYYQDKLAGPLFVEGVTSYDVERYTEAELVAIMRRLRDDDEHHADMCDAAARRFRNLVDFDGEANAIAQMVGL